ADEHARRSGALCLPAGELDAACADHGFEVVVELLKVAVHDGKFGGAIDVIVRFVQTKQNIIPQGVAEQARDLCSVGASWRDEEVAGIGDDLSIPTDFA